MTETKAKVYDLGAIMEREAAENPGITFTLGGKKFTIPAPIKWPDAAREAADSDNLVEAARLLLGGQYAAFADKGGTAVALMALVGEAFGADVPESSASTDS